MPSDSVSVDKARFELTTNFVRVQLIGSPDIVLVGLVSDTCFAELALSDSGNLRDRTDWSSRMLSSRSEPGSLSMVYRIPII